MGGGRSNGDREERWVRWCATRARFDGFMAELKKMEWCGGGSFQWSEGEGEGDGCEMLWVVSTGSGERGRIGEGRRWSAGEKMRRGRRRGAEEELVVSEMRGREGTGDCFRRVCFGGREKKWEERIERREGGGGGLAEGRE
ncbi:hypothetical protein HAX54_015823 [Datura stramonium]|uniref:Uncharacterized protein n=1 Tax=Datura stramonium TaxID=4076 RepID=A0ABS8UIH6_DATST|nr:hypothetical protein [Datura stramonium]